MPSSNSSDNPLTGQFDEFVENTIPECDSEWNGCRIPGLARRAGNHLIDSDEFVEDIEPEATSPSGTDMCLIYGHVWIRVWDGGRGLA
ncbi:hypothetical protein GCM10025792_37860 [Pseudonocardia tropica]